MRRRSGLGTGAPCPVCGASAWPPRCARCRRWLPEVPEAGAVLSLHEATGSAGRGGDAASALPGLTLDVRRGEVVLLAGLSPGCTTTAMLLLGLVRRPGAGVVAWHGRDLGHADPATLARLRLLGVGFLFRDASLLAGLSLLENVALPLKLAGVSAAVATARSAELLCDVGLGTRIEHRPDGLSRDEEQRVALARALAVGPDLVLADEPAAGLGPARGRDLMELLVGMARTQGSGTVVVTCDLRFADLADRVLTLAPTPSTQRATRTPGRAPCRGGAQASPPAFPLVPAVTSWRRYFAIACPTTLGSTSPRSASICSALTATDGPSILKNRRAAWRVSENPNPSAPSVPKSPGTHSRI